MADNKVSLLFETNNILDPDQSFDNLLLSGPVNIFAAVDNVFCTDENGKQYVVPSVADINSAGFSIDDFDIVSLQSPYMDDLIKEQLQADPTSTIVVYVKDVRNYHGDLQDDQNHRGAYFFFTGFNDRGNAKWQEIILGTHSHANPKILENLALAPYSNIKDPNGLIVIAKPDGTFDFEERQSKLVLPDLPTDYLETLAEYRRTVDRDEPDFDGYHHLDAPLEELQDTYDWLRQDENGNYINIAVGTCRDLYRAAKKAGRKLYITETGEITDKAENGKFWFDLEAFEIDYTGNGETTDTIIAAKENPVNSDELLISLPLADKIYSVDKFFVFDDGTLLPFDDSDLSHDGWSSVAYSNDEKVLTIKVKKDKFRYSEPRKLSLLLARDVENLSIQEIESIFTDTTLVDANDQILRQYLKDEISKRPTLPHLYLMTDKDGNLTWDNNILPSQFFFAKKIEINRSYIQTHSESGNLKINLTDVFYNIGKDFPIILVDDIFAFNARIEANKNDAIVYIPLNGGHYDFDINDGELVTITILIVKQSSAESVADMVADNYLSKKDAVEILSRGKINLSDYATKAELREKYAKKYHTHSVFAAKTHNHDERYANFQHTHPELYLAIAKMILGENISYAALQELENQIDNAVNELNSKVLVQYSKLEALYSKLDDSRIGVSEEIKETVDDLIEIFNETNPNNQLEEFTGNTLTEVLKKLIELFNKGSLTLSNIVLDTNIVATEEVGGIKPGKTYFAGTSLQNVITDMLNPYKDRVETTKILTPTKNSEIIWYMKDSTGNMTILKDISKIPSVYDDDGIYTIYFKFNFKNEYNESCNMTSFDSISGVKYIETSLPDQVTVNGLAVNRTEDGLYKYGDVDFNNVIESKTIETSWIGYDPGELHADRDYVFDNYRSHSFKLNPDENKLTFVGGEDFIFELDTPDIFIGAIGSSEMISKDDIRLSPLYFDGNELKKEITTVANRSKIIILSEYTLKIIDNFSQDDITNCFETNFDLNSGYRSYIFDVYVRDTVNHCFRIIKVGEE